MKIAVVRVRGLTGIRRSVKDTLSMVRLYRKNFCIFLEDTPTNRGMVEKIKDYVTFGMVDEAKFQEYYTKRGEEFLGKTESKNKSIQYHTFVTLNNKNFKPFLRLNSPKSGFGRKGLKLTFLQGGALGNRGDKISDLIERML